MAAIISSSLLTVVSKKVLFHGRPITDSNHSSPRPYVVAFNVPAVTSTTRGRGRRVSSSIRCCCNSEQKDVSRRVREKPLHKKILENYKKLHKYPGVEIDYILKEEDDATRWKWLTGGVDILTIMPPDAPRLGVLVLVEALRREGVTDVFTNKEHRIPIKALSGTSSAIKTHTFLTHCSELLAAIGYAMATGLPGVCMTSFVSDDLKRQFIPRMAYAYEQCIPLVVVVVDGWEKMKDQKSNYEENGRDLDEMLKCRLRITSTKDIQQVVRKAFFLARSGCPGPVLIDHVSYESVNELHTPDWEEYYKEEEEEEEEATILCSQPDLVEPSKAQLEKVIGLLKEAKRPLLYVGNGRFEWRRELTRFVELTEVPVLRSAVMSQTPIYLEHDWYSEIYFNDELKPFSKLSVEDFDLLLVLDNKPFYHEILNLRHRDSVVLQFGDFDIAEEEEEVDDKPGGGVTSIRCRDVRSLVERLNHLLEEGNVGSDLDLSSWRKEIYRSRICGRMSDFVKDVLNDIANRGDTFILASDTNYRVRFWDWFTRDLLRPQGDYERMSFSMNKWYVSLPVAVGAAIGKGKRNISSNVCGGDDDKEEEIGVSSSRNNNNVIHIERGYGWVNGGENYEELSVVKRENLPLKVVFLNEISFSYFEYDSEDEDEEEEEIVDLVRMARSFEIPCRRIGKKEEVRDAMKVMMETPGPYVLEIIYPEEFFDGPRTVELEALDDQLCDFWKKRSG